MLCKKMLCTLTVILCNIILSQCSHKPNGGQEVSQYLPKSTELDGWKPTEAPQTYVGKELFALINGGADIYYEYGFKQVVTQEYQNKNLKTINLELYEMKEPASAYGMYTFKTGEAGQEISLGNEGLLEDYYLNFWKGKFLATLVGFDSEKETLDGLMTIANMLDKKIESTGQKPRLVDLLTDENLNRSSIKYLKGNLALYNYYVFDSANIFGLSEAVAGNYGDYDLCIVKYKDENESTVWFKNAINHLKNKSDFRDVNLQGNALSMIDSKNMRISVESYQNYIFIIIGSNQTDAAKISAKVKDRI